MNGAASEPGLLSARGLGRLLAAVLLVTALHGARAGATTPSSTGWWWIGHQSSVPVDPPVAPDVPSGGLYVAATPTGEAGVSALRFRLSRDVDTADLTLTVAEATGDPLLQACPADGPWEPAAGGSWDDRPEADCEAASVAGTFSPDTSTVTFALAELVRAATLDVVLVPGVDEESGLTTAFSVSFERPGDGALTISPPRREAGTTASPIPAVPAVPATDEGSSEPPARATPFTPRTSSAPPAPDAGILPDASVEPRPSQAPAARGASFLPGAVDDRFQYPVALTFPLLLVAVGGYLAWALSRPVTVTRW